ncbi:MULTISPECIES: hypothetical protein [Streptomyces]|uniref:hypothetical protein n=1 Tax=Streptomyces lycopersici TaxID=2974589 RepID=UPI0021CEEA7E|nr:hypothetical protein [Streptomyces sp. NEAU-383]
MTRPATIAYDERLTAPRTWRLIALRFAESWAPPRGLTADSDLSLDAANECTTQDV